jgi:hypothetical protein
MVAMPKRAFMVCRVRRFDQPAPPWCAIATATPSVGLRTQGAESASWMAGPGFQVAQTGPGRDPS